MWGMGRGGEEWTPVNEHPWIPLRKEGAELWPCPNYSDLYGHDCSYMILTRKKIVVFMMIYCFVFQLISHLHDVVLRRDDAGNPIETKLHQLSSDLYTVITNNLQVGDAG